MSCNQSSTFPSSPASAVLSLGSNKPVRILEITGSKRQQNRVYQLDGISPCLVAMQRPPNVLVTAKSTPMPGRSISDISPTTDRSVISLRSIPITCLISTFCVADFLVSLSRSQESEKDWKTQEVLSFLTSLGSSSANTHGLFCLKTSKASCLTRTGELRSCALKHLMTWGMTVNGKCLTARISACRRTGNGSSLLDILEVNPDAKYFLSSDRCKTLLMGA